MDKKLLKLVAVEQRKIFDKPQKRLTNKIISRILLPLEKHKVTK